MEHLTPLVLRNESIALRYYQLDFEWPMSLQPPLPGQFMTLRVAPTAMPLLRRPFAFSAFEPKKRVASMIYERRGSATQMLTSLKPGDHLDAIAPLGNFFPPPAEGARPILLAGGIGMGPMFFFAEALAELGRNPLLLVGARTAALIPHLPVFALAETIVATDDGSRGFAGNIVECLRRYGIDWTNEAVELYACGPHPMLEAAHRLAQEHRSRFWVSMEQTMGCAVGACMGCVISIRGESKYARVCTEGPIFDAEDIEWEAAHV